MRFVASLLLMALLFVQPASALILSEGETYVFEFSTMREKQEGELRFDADVHLFFSYESDVFDFTEQMEFRFYEDSLLDEPWWIVTSENNSSEELSYPSHILFSETSQWTDLQGVISITMLSGSVDLKSIYVERTIDESSYSTTIAIPEPLSLSYIGAGVFGVLALVRRRRGQRKVATRG